MASSEESPQIPMAAAGENPPPAAPGAVNPSALTADQLARMLAIPPETIRRHLAAGGPASADGRINLVQYAAWLNKELAKNDGD